MNNFSKQAVIILSILVGGLIPAFAQDSKNRKAISNSIEGRLEHLSSDLIARYIPKNLFRVAVSVDIKDVDRSWVYGANIAFEKKFVGLSFSALAPYIVRARYKVYLANSINNESLEAIKSILEDNINETFAYSLEFARLNIILEEKEDSLLVKENDLLKNKLLTLESEINKLSRERNDAKIELSTAMNDLKKEVIQKDSIAEQLAKKTKEIEILKEQIDQNNIEKVDVNLSKDRVNIIVASLLGLLLLVTLYFCFSIFGKSISGVGKSIGLIADSLKGGQSNSAGSAKQENKADFKKQSQSNSAESAPSLATQLQQLEKLKVEIGDGVSEYPMVVARHIQLLLTREDGNMLGIASLEVLPRKVAAFCYEELGSKLQRKVKDFLDSGTYPAGKIATQLQACEQIMTVLNFQQVVSDQFALDPGNLVGIRGLEISDKVVFLQAIPPDLVKRFSQYLEKKELGEILSELRKLNKNRFAEEIIAHITSDRDITDNDDQLLHQEIETYKRSKNSQNTSQSIDYFVKLSMHLQRDDRDNLIASLQKSMSLSSLDIAKLFLSAESIPFLTKTSINALVERLSLDHLCALDQSHSTIYEQVETSLSPVRKEAVEDRRNLVITLDEKQQERWIIDQLESIKELMFSLKDEQLLEFEQQDHIDNNSQQNAS